MSTNYVWYASYGSNINKDRFLCYIKGGQPMGSTKIERGCKDQTLPIDEQAFIIPISFILPKKQGNGTAKVWHLLTWKGIRTPYLQ